MISYEKAQLLKSLIDNNYRDMNDETFLEIKNMLQNIGKDKLDYVVKRALGLVK